jgi:molybdopterin converting factor small subunit
MAVTIKLPTPFRRHADGARTAVLEAATVGAALAALVESHPAMRPALYADDGELKRVVRIFVGEDDIRSLQGTGTPLADGAVISIIPPIAGA